MMRAIALVAAGTLTGAIAVVWMRSGEQQDDTVAQPELPSIAAPDSAESPPGSTTVEAPTLVPGELESRVSELLDASASIDGELELRALLEDLVVIAPDRALGLVSTRDVSPELVESVFRTWAEQATSPALGALIGLEPAATRLAAALGIVEALGGDAWAIERVGAALATEEREDLKVEALARLAVRDFEAAMQSAAALTVVETRDRALQRIAELTFGGDLAIALAAAEGLDQRSRNQYLRRVFETWGAVDAAGELAWLARNLAALSDYPLDWRPLAAFDPQAVLQLADRLDPDAALNDFQQARSTALRELTSRNPVAGIAYLEAMPSGRQKDMLFQTVAVEYARDDPDAAWAWAKQLEPPSQSALNMIVVNHAAEKLDRMLDFLLEDAIENRGMSTFPSLMTSVLDSAAMRRTVDRFAAEDGERADLLLTGALTAWARAEPEVVLDWQIEHAAELDANTMFRGFDVAIDRDPGFAVRTFERLPADLRLPWFTKIGAQLTESSPAEAQALLSRLEGQPGYETALAAMIRGTAASDPRAAARMLEQISPAAQREHVANISANLARVNGAEAAAWAENLADPTNRSSAVGSVALFWAQTEPVLVRAWVQTMPAGPARAIATR